MNAGRWLRAAALRVVPRQWRDSVRDDLDEETARGTVAHWRAGVEVVAVGIGLHWTFTRSAVMSDFRYAIRSLLYARWFTLGAVLTFAIGIGVNGAVFALVDRALFRPLPFANPDRLVLITQGAYTQPESPIIAVRQAGTAFADIASVEMPEKFLIDGPDAPPLQLADVTFNAFDVLGVSPILGRPFSRGDVESDIQYVLLKEEVWRSRFGSDPTIVGRRWINLKRPLEVRGVLPAGLISPTVNWTEVADGYVVSSDLLDTSTPTSSIAAPVARLKPGVTLPEAQAAFDAAWKATARERPPEFDKYKPTVQPLQPAMFWNFRTEASLLAAGGGIVWLIACVNLGTLLLARSRSRDRDVAVRASLGASFSRILSATALESMLLACAGGLVALGVLTLSLQALEATIPTYAQSVFLTAIDRRLVGLVAIGTVVGSVIAALWPVIRAVRTDPYAALDRGPAAGRQARSRVGRGLLVLESALATVLVLAGLLAVASFATLLQTDLGFAPTDLYAVDFTSPTTLDTPDARFAFDTKALAALRDVPGVIAASFADAVPFGGGGAMSTGVINGVRVPLVRVSDGYFETSRTPLVAGTLFTPAVHLSGAPVAVLSRAAAAVAFPNESLATLPGRPLAVPNEPDRTVLGIVEDTKLTAGAKPRPSIYLAATSAIRRADFLIRLRPGPPISTAALTAAIAPRLGTAVKARVYPAGSYASAALQNPRLYSRLFGAFGTIALVLAAVGLFAMTSFDVAMRRYELGVRMTLGASAREIRRLIIGEAIRPILVGVAIGSVVAFWAAGYFQSLLGDLSARNPLGYVAVAVVLVGTAALAASVPARRASRVDPAIVLRAQ